MVDVRTKFVRTCEIEKIIISAEIVRTKFVRTHVVYNVVQKRSQIEKHCPSQGLYLLMWMRIQISTRIFDFNVSLELSIGNQNACRTSNSSSTWNFDLKLQNEIGNWNSKMRFHVEASNWSCNIESVNWNAICNFNLQLRLKTSTCNWMRSFDRFKLTFNLEFWPEISTRNLD